jgi:hypothetical protein
MAEDEEDRISGKGSRKPKKEKDSIYFIEFKKFDDERKKEQQQQKVIFEKQIRDLLTTDWLKKIPNRIDLVVQETPRQEIIKKLSYAFRNEKLVFVLGAGISIDYGLPSWNILLQKLLVTTIEKDQRASNALSKLFTELFAPNPIIAGRYLQKYYESKDSSFEEAVRKALYSNINMSKSSPIMDEIVKFCVAPGKSPNLDSIISHNFDDLVEQHLNKTSVEIPYKAIHGLGMNPEPGELPIYHVHGYLPQKGKLSTDNQITFGESIYHKQYNDIYSWNNIVQINKFRDNTCLFIGSSLTDPNIRRLLDIAKTQKGNTEEYHYIFKKKYKVTDIDVKLKKLLEENKILLDEKIAANLNFDETGKFLIKTIETFEENDSSSFGVKTIWIEDFYEIPEILKEIRVRRKV